MKELLERLEKHKCKHNLDYRFGTTTYDDCTTSIDFSIFGNNWCGIINIYSWRDEQCQKLEVEQIKKLLNNKRKALLFIGTRPEGY